MRRAKRLAAVVGLLLASVAVYFVLSEGAGNSCDEPFDPADWKRDRDQVARRLDHCHAFRGESAQTVQRLLGRPDDRYSDGFGYIVGEDFTGDEETLAFRVKRGIVEDVRL